MNAPATTQPAVAAVVTEGSVSEPAASTGLLDAILTQPGRNGAPQDLDADSLNGFLSAADPAEALRQWLGDLPRLSVPALKQHIIRRLSRDIARIDALLNRQVNAILHHPDFQRLEASWRSLRRLVDQAPEGGPVPVKIRVLNVSWRELTRDLTVHAVEFDHSNLFRKVYSDEFGMAGGEPFGVLLGDYEIRHRMTADHPYNDLETLAAVSEVAAASFAPFIAAAHPSLLELPSFADLERPLDLTRTFDQLDYLKWRAFRKKDEARFVGLTLPRVLVRLPYRDDSARGDGFVFHEDVAGPDARKYLWGNAAYAFGGVLIRAFADNGWLADIRGVRRGELGGGLVTGLPVHSFSTDRTGVSTKCSTDAIITDAQEKELGLLGFIPLCHCQDTIYSAFYGNQSVQEPLKYDQPAARANAQLSAMLQYILCASRFAHYLKVMGRDLMGSFTNAAEVQDVWRRWLTQYTTASDRASPELKAKHPLREARVDVEEVPGQPGAFTCRFFLRPHYQLDQLASVLRLDSKLAPRKPS